MDGVVYATTVWICCFLVWKEGGRAVLRVLVRDIMFDVFLPCPCPLLGLLVLPY